LLANLLDYNEDKLKILFKTWNEPAFRAKQIIKWIHQEKVFNFDEMLNISKSMRTRLADTFEIRLPRVYEESIAEDGTHRYVFELDCKNKIETVLIPEKNRNTLCISSQAGCAANCHFCSTAQGGFNKQMSTGDVIGQLLYVSMHYKVTNVVMMGMGEPLLNTDNVLPALSLMLSNDAYGLSKNRVTVSTIGIIPGMLALKDYCDAALTVSLHATNNELRTKIMPINKKYPLEELLPVCKDYFADTRRCITFAYIMLKDVNDTKKDAIQLAKIANDIKAKVNLIPFNTFPNAIFTSSSIDTIENFKEILKSKGVQTMIRRTRGEDVNAACGQLVGDILKRKKKTHQPTI